MQDTASAPKKARGFLEAKSTSQAKCISATGLCRLIAKQGRAPMAFQWPHVKLFEVHLPGGQSQMVPESCMEPLRVAGLLLNPGAQSWAAALACKWAPQIQA